jgi:uncharacterized membrane protein
MVFFAHRSTVEAILTSWSISSSLIRRTMEHRFRNYARAEHLLVYVLARYSSAWGGTAEFGYGARYHILQYVSMQRQAVESQSVKHATCIFSRPAANEA